MPQVPAITAPNLTPPPEMNPRIAGRPGEAMANAAEQFGSVAEMGAQVADRLKKAQDEGIMLDAENQITADMQTAETGLNTWTDYTHADGMKQQTEDALREKYTEKYGNRPDLMRFIEPYLGRQLNNYNRAVDVRTAKLTQDFNQAALTHAGLHAADEAATEPTLEGKQTIWGAQDAKIDAMVQNGSLWHTQGEAAKRQLRAQTIATEVDRAANPLNAPEIMASEIENLKQYVGKDYVDPKELAAFQEHLGEAYKVALVRAGNMDVSKQVDAVVTAAESNPSYNSTDNTGDKDYPAMQKNVDDNTTLPLKVRQAARQEFEARRVVQARRNAERDQKQWDDNQPRLYDTKHPLTEQEIKSRALLPHGDPAWLSRASESHLLVAARQLVRDNKAATLPEKMADRQQTANESAQLQRALGSKPGWIADKSELYQGDYAKLTKADRESLWIQKNINGSRDYQDAAKLLASSPVYPQTDEGNVNLANDKIKLKQEVDAHHLVGNQITEAASAMLKPKEVAQRENTVKTLLDNIWPVARNVLSGGSIPVYGLKLPAGETSAQAKEGDTRINPSGDKVIFKDGKWGLQ